MRFVPYTDLESVPNVIVDGARAPSTVLTLSHWPKSGTPAELKADTSTAIVFNYIDRPSFRADADAVSNNHFDEDGLVGILILVDPALAARHRELLIDVAQAGDFGVYSHRTAARIAFTLSAFADAETSPFPKQIFSLPYPRLTAELYTRLLGLLPGILARVDDYQTLWADEDEKLSASEALIDSGLITITERTDLDLAVIRLPDDLLSAPVHRFAQRRLSECHSLALHNRTACSRLLIVQGSLAEVQYRYEGWVQMATRRPALRVDLTALAGELNQAETSGGRWVFDRVDAITPRLHLEGSSETSIPTDFIQHRLEHHLRTGAPAWDPYDSD